MGQGWEGVGRVGWDGGKNEWPQMYVLGMVEKTKEEYRATNMTI